MFRTNAYEGEMRGFLVGLDIGVRHQILSIEASLEELGALADTAGIHVVGQTSQRVTNPDPATFVKKGKVDEIRQWVRDLEVDIVIFDDELLPRHQRELEEVFGDEVRVIDRTALILDIFAQHAHTREGAAQVALAQYEYRLPRLTRRWTHLARQAGGAAARGGVGGVGLRGPGETQLETDRRDIRRRISRLREEIGALRAHRDRHRTQRRRRRIPVVALVGYTNAGKSTLLNRLSGSSVLVADQLFATLDPTVRRVLLPGRQTVLMADTVGFIQKLPHTLVAAFRATLEEISEADLLVHVVDVSHPDALEQARVVEDTLMGELGIPSLPGVMALNKIDLAKGREELETLDSLCSRYPGCVRVSARDGFGMDELLQRIQETLEPGFVRIVVRIPYSQGALIARFRENAIVELEEHEDAYVRLVGTLHSGFAETYSDYIV